LVGGALAAGGGHARNRPARSLHPGRDWENEAPATRAARGLVQASFRARVWRPATRAAGLDGLRIHDLRHTAVALWIAAGANPKEVAARAGHASVSFTLDRYGHLYPEADTALRDRLDALYGAARSTPEGTVVRLHGHAGRGPSVAPGGPGDHKSAAPGKRTAP
jgi:integrase-like protein